MKAKVIGLGTVAMKRELVAPCGMNCNLCSWVLDPSKPGCVGCRPRGRGCVHKKGLCRKLAKQEIGFCYQCGEFPCASLLLIEQRYVRAHNVSFVENLEYIRRRGMPAFLRRETKRYTCPSCGKLLTVHSDKCPHCGQRHNRKNRRYGSTGVLVGWSAVPVTRTAVYFNSSGILNNSSSGSMLTRKFLYNPFSLPSRP